MKRYLEDQVVHDLEQKMVFLGDLYRRGGDSLQGRYHYLRLYPISIDELTRETKAFDQKTFKHLYQLGGFPEPFLRGNKIDVKR